MNAIPPSSLLNQLNAYKEVATNSGGAIDVSSVKPDADKFSNLLKQSIDKVNALQSHAGEMGNAFQMGEPNVSLAEVMIAKQKASIAFESVLQVRNKLMSAYKEIMAMQV